MPKGREPPARRDRDEVPPDDESSFDDEEVEPTDADFVDEDKGSSGADHGWDEWDDEWHDD